MISAIVTDIEGTTSSIAFVKDVLFPYAAAKLPEYLQLHKRSSAVATILADVARDSGAQPDDIDALTAHLLQWLAEDRKVTALKTLQGMIWKEGYESGKYQAHLYPDVAPALQRWHASGIALYVYSSGSIAAQKLFFTHSNAGNISPLFRGYFDTTTGPKQDVNAYWAIAKTLALEPASILFLSDTLAELDAAQQAGMATCWLQRSGSAGDAAANHRKAHDFNSVEPIE